MRRRRQLLVCALLGTLSFLAMCAMIVLWQPAWPSSEGATAEVRLRGSHETLRVVERRSFGWSTLELTPYHDFLPLYLEDRPASEAWAERWGDRYDRSPSMAMTLGWPMTAFDCEFASAWRLEFDFPNLRGWRDAPPAGTRVVPLRPRPVGLAVDVSIHAIAVWLLIYGWRAARGYIRAARGHCGACEHDLAGAGQWPTRCPECGRRTRPRPAGALAVTAASLGWHPRRARTYLAVGALLAVLVAVGHTLIASASWRHVSLGAQIFLANAGGQVVVQNPANERIKAAAGWPRPVFEGSADIATGASGEPATVTAIDRAWAIARPVGAPRVIPYGVRGMAWLIDVLFWALAAWVTVFAAGVARNRTRRRITIPADLS